MKECTLCAYPKDVGEDTKVAWDVCVRAMDACRGKGSSQEEKSLISDCLLRVELREIVL